MRCLQKRKSLQPTRSRSSRAGQLLGRGPCATQAVRVNYQVIVRPLAERDILDAKAWYDLRRPGLGSEFLDTLDELQGRLKRTPLVYPVVYRGMRRAVLRRFPQSRRLPRATPSEICRASQGRTAQAGGDSVRASRQSSWLPGPYIASNPLVRGSRHRSQGTEDQALSGVTPCLKLLRRT